MRLPVSVGSGTPELRVTLRRQVHKTKMACGETPESRNPACNGLAVIGHLSERLQLNPEKQMAKHIRACGNVVAALQATF
jgi:hypothetical protein